MASVGAISVSKHANTLLLSFPRHLRTMFIVYGSNPCWKSRILSTPQAGANFAIRAISAKSADPVAPKIDSDNPSLQKWKIKMLYDGECPLCMREVNMLMERNKSFGTIKFVDISSDEYRAEDNEGLDYKTVMGRIHAILSDGTVVTDIEVFRKLYEAVGLGWVYAITKYEPVASIADAIYGVWAKYRLPMTGRPPLDEVLELRRKKIELCGGSSSKVCKM